MILSLAIDGLPPDELRAAGDALAEADVRATFFVNPPKVLDNLAAWQALAEAGHEIANAALSGVSLSGELVNWTLRMVEQDLHMTQSFLEDVFGERAVPVFAYPGPFTRCADGNYQEIVDSLFALAITPGDLETAPSEKSVRRVSPEAWPVTAEWVVVGVTAADSIRALLAERVGDVLPIFEAAKRLGRVPAP